jgi:hypothetical protein
MTFDKSDISEDRIFYEWDGSEKENMERVRYG